MTRKTRKPRNTASIVSGKPINCTCAAAGPWAVSKPINTMTALNTGHRSGKTGRSQKRWPAVETAVYRTCTYLRHTAARNQLLVIDEPESHLDTENQIELARTLTRLVRSGIKILVTTHSDYLIKEINNLVMLIQLDGLPSSCRRRGYRADDGLRPECIRAYVAENNSLTRCVVDEYGVEMAVRPHHRRDQRGGVRTDG